MGGCEQVSVNLEYDQVTMNERHIENTGTRNKIGSVTMYNVTLRFVWTFAVSQSAYWSSNYPRITCPT
jgi:hypothetical protein